MPLISIIIPCFNQAHFLPDCLNSILSQNLNDWEAIVVNDGSTDKTKEVAEDFAKRDARIQLINQSNGGLSNARNTGIEKAKGKYYQFVDSDDYLLEGCLQMVAQKIKEINNPDYLIQTGNTMVDLNKKVLWTKSLPEGISPLWEIVKKGGIGPPLSLFVSKELVQQIGGFDEKLRSAEDWDYWLKAAKFSAKLCRIAKPLVAYRYLDSSMSRNPWQMLNNTEEVISRINDSLVIGMQKLDEEEHKNLFKRNLLQCVGLGVLKGEIDESLKVFKEKSIQFDFQYNAHEFSYMNSFLGQRYQYDRNTVFRFLNEYLSNYKAFFSKTNFSQGFKKIALRYIRERHQKNLHHIKFGKMGKAINFIWDLPFRLIKVHPEKGY
jgi:glycosyltransferase involved in cell wall biosynthesis